MILTINLGSASKKYALYDADRKLLTAHFERGEDGGHIATFEYGTTEEHYPVGDTDYSDSLSHVLNFVTSNGALSEKIPKTVPDYIGIRVVAPGLYFTANRFINKNYLERLEEANVITPVHIFPVLEEIEKIKFHLPETDLIGISDSAFHSGMPEVARRYALPNQMAEKYGIYRYGYHGLSVASAMGKLKNMPGGITPKTIVCHLGSGASVTALFKGESIDTSMGFTPLEGVPMGSRSGSIDAGAVYYLGKMLKLPPEKVSLLLNEESGLLGISGETSDIRELLALESEGEMDAKLALDIFTYKIRQHIGAYIASLGGLDTLVFTGTVGERSSVIRARVCEGLEEMGIHLDLRENDSYNGNKDGSIQTIGSLVSVIVLVSDEMGEMARLTHQFIESSEA